MKIVTTDFAAEKKNLQANWGGAGFTLLEVLTVVILLGIIASIVAVQFMDFTDETEASAVAHSFRVVGRAFECYRAKEGAFPADVGRGNCPAGMSAYLSNLDWSLEENTGGRWDWDRNAQGANACICLVGVTWSEDKMMEVDAILDDGNLSTGGFYYQSGHYVYVVEK